MGCSRGALPGQVGPGISDHTCGLALDLRTCLTSACRLPELRVSNCGSPGRQERARRGSSLFSGRPLSQISRHRKLEESPSQSNDLTSGKRGLVFAPLWLGERGGWSGSPWVDYSLWSSPWCQLLRNAYCALYPLQSAQEAGGGREQDQKEGGRG